VLKAAKPLTLENPWEQSGSTGILPVIRVEGYDNYSQSANNEPSVYLAISTAIPEDPFI
jgi:hypothetical protein